MPSFQQAAGAQISIPQKNKWKKNCMQLNFDKSEIFCYGEAKDFEDQYIELFRCVTMQVNTPLVI
jgi:hypothetical protein